jgi:site-specific DNA-methyltransferase (adenine-specific)
MYEIAEDFLKVFVEEANYGHKQKYFRHKNTLLFHRDTLNTELFDKQFIDLIVTSPPYNVGIEYHSNNDELSYEQYLTFSEQWMQNCFDWSKPQARFCLNIPLDKNKGGTRAVGSDLTKIAQKVGWKYKSTIIWNEGNISRRTAWGSWKSASAPVVIAPVELIVVLYKDEWKKTNGSKISDITGDEFKDWTQGVWTFNGESKKRIGHPAPFPKDLPYRCIKLFSYVNDLVFDPFAGSGTTLLVAQNLNRKAIGVEIDSEYYELAKNRILKETGTLI